MSVGEFPKWGDGTRAVQFRLVASILEMLEKGDGGFLSACYLIPKGKTKAYVF